MSEDAPHTNKKNAEEEGDEPIRAPELVLPSEVHVVPLRETVVFPQQAATLQIGRPESLRAVEEVMAQPEKVLGLFTQRTPDSDEPRGSDLYDIGTAATILKLLRYPEGNVMILVKGIERVRATEFLDGKGPLRARIEPVPDVVKAEEIEVEALLKALRSQMQEMLDLMPFVPEELKLTLMNVDDPGHLANLVVAYMDAKTEDKQKILETLEVRDRLDQVVRMVRRETEVLQIGSKIQKDVRSSMDEKMREQYLREQMKAIQRELGEGEEDNADVKDLREQIAKAEMPEKVEEEAIRELERLARMHPATGEYTVVRTYLDWLVNLPWKKASKDRLDIPKARANLDEDHYDLREVKDRILEYLAVRKLSPERKGPILCLAGPPGTGKTSLARSIARSMGREYVRMSLGGMRDEAEIRGHRRTYVGAMPGRIIQGLRKAGTRNPVFLLDEVDKIGQDFRGDPAAALLEVLDPEQNANFVDLYLATPFDLSKVFFITTANTLHTIPTPLLDRMEVIEVAGYTLHEKVEIAERYLIPRQREQHGLKDSQIQIEEEALRTIIDSYTREAGLRNLEREIGKICRKAALRITEEGAAAIRVTTQNLQDFLGPQRFFPELAERTDTPGVAVGLAWTPTGGDILFIEATRMRGKGQLTLTGSLGDVMKESAMAALAYLRSNAPRFGIDADFYAVSDIHVHVPAGAIPKDGPSAGVTISTALASLLTGRPCRDEVAMTGEITLRGKVMPVGGIKEKVLAAKRAGIKTIILPDHNRKDVEQIEEEQRAGLEFQYVHTLEEVFRDALEPAPRQEETAAAPLRER